MKKKISLVLMTSLLMSSFAGVANSACINIADETAVVLSGNYKGERSCVVIGGIYSADGDVMFGEGFELVSGDVVYNSDNKSNIADNSVNHIGGEVKVVDETSFDYTVDDVAVEDGDVSIFEGREYAEKEWFTVAGWTTGGAVTINSDTYFKSGLTLQDDLIVDTTEGDVYVKIDSLTIQNGAMIKVSGEGKLHLMVNPSWGTVGLYLDTDGDKEKADVYISGKDNVNIQGIICADIYVDAPSVSISGSGDTSVVADIYALSADKMTISNDVTGDIVTTAKKIDITGGDARVTGVLFAPEADVSIYATGNHEEDDADIKGQLVAKSLKMLGNGKVMYNEKIVEDFGVTEVPEATVEPTATPEATTEPTATPEATAEPTAEPTATPEATVEPADEEEEDKVDYTVLVPSNPIPEGPKKTLKSDLAYLYGYSDNWVGADMPITREEVCALVNRLLVQNDARDDYKKPETQSYKNVSSSHWSYSAIEYMSYIGVYSTDDGTGEMRGMPYSEEVTRGEVAKIIAFSLRLPYEEGDIGFDDVSEDHPFYMYLKAMVDEGLFEGDNGRLKPDAVMTRAEFVTMFNRIIGRTEEEGYEVTEADCPFIYNNGDGDLFLPEGTLDEDGNDIGHWAYYEITRAACSFTNKKVDPDKKLDRGWLDAQ